MSSEDNHLNHLSNGLPSVGLTTIVSNSTPLASSVASSSTMNNGPAASSVVLTTSNSPVNARPSTSQPEQIIVPVGNVMKLSDSSSSRSTSSSQPSINVSATQCSSGSDVRAALDRSRLRELVKEVDPLEQMDDDVEEVLLQVADDFIENVVAASCQLAKHRRSNMLEAKDVQLYLERNWNMQIPGFGSEEIRPYKKSVTTEAHKQRMGLIRKTIKKC